VVLEMVHEFASVTSAQELIFEAALALGPAEMAFVVLGHLDPVVPGVQNSTNDSAVISWADPVLRLFRTGTL
jgi:hypothetical protein